ncbi:importin-9-like [Drosophila sulfurigaster albostrigata]|uniref:importin-9-like n=1 Tax=Drosophila sulfurigaster albostrigata TaxID=89887 RepID=UPI002D2193E5|nr:importin-9-like [Drosophila sulfurigaster albostrigata]
MSSGESGVFVVRGSGDSVKQAIIEELQNLLSSDTVVLQQAEKRNMQLQYTEGYGVYLAEIIMNQSHELPLRQIAIIMLTRYVENHWTDLDDREKASGGVASEQAKRTIRNILPNGLYDPNSKIRSSVACTISTIAATDYPHCWAELFDIIVKCLSGNEDSIHGALQVLRNFIYDVAQIKKLGPVVIPAVYRIFDSEQNYSIKTRVSAIRTLKELFTDILTLITDKQEQSSMMNSILTNFMNEFLHYLSMNCGAGSSFLLRSEIIGVFTYLPKYINPFMERILPIVWQLLTQIADTYVKVSVNQTEPNPLASGTNEEDDEQTNFLIQILEFINCIVTCRKLRGTIKNVLADLIYITIVYMQLIQEQLEDWEEDPEKFVDDENDGGVELTVRMCGRDVLLAINDEFGVKAIQPLQEALGRHFSVAEAEKAANNPNWWKIHEACMNAVHGFRDIILEGDSEFDLLNYLTIVRNLLVHQESPHLVGHALCTLSTYSKTDLYNPQILSEILDVTLCSLSPEKSHILRIRAVKSLNGFLSANENAEGERRTLLVSKLPGFLDGIMALVQGRKASVLALLMEALTMMVKFDADFAYAAQPKITPLTIAAFLKYAEDPYVLQNVQDLIKALSQQKQCLGPLQEKFIPTIVSILALQSEQCSEKQDIALDVLNTIVRNSEAPLSNALIETDIALDVLNTIVRNSEAPLSNALIETAFPAVVNCVMHTDDHTVMVAGGKCLRSFINVSPEQIFSYKNGEGVNYVMQVATVLLNPMNTEMTAGGQIGRLVITIITKMGNMLGQTVDMLLKAVISKMQNLECLEVIMNLVLISAHLFLTQMDSVLNFLSTVPGPNGEPALQFVLTNWLSRQNSFGAYERKVTTMALCKLFEYGVATQDNRLTTYKELVHEPSGNRVCTRSVASSYEKWVTIPALVKIFKVLISEYQHFQESKIDAPLTDSEDEVSGDDDAPGTAAKPRYVSDLCFEIDEDEDEDEVEGEQILQDLLKESNYSSDIGDNLHKFLANFTQNEHFPTFFEHLDEGERLTLLNKVQHK